MPRLIAKSALEAVLPVVADGVRLTELDLGQMTSVAPLAGKDRALAAALKGLGLKFPPPNGSSTAKGGARLLWWGRGQAMLVGAVPPETLAGAAALTDQSDGWAAMRLEGPLAGAALARLVPVDLRADAFPVGQSARTMLFHMTCTLVRVGPDAFEIMVLRSFGRTAVHDLSVAMRSVAAQA